MPINELTRHILADKDFTGGISRLPDKEEIIDKINEIVREVNRLSVEKQDKSDCNC